MSLYHGAQTGLKNLSARTSNGLDVTKAHPLRPLAPSAEFEVLLHACASPPRIESLQEDCPRLTSEQWDHFLGLADSHGVGSLAYSAFNELGIAAPPRVTAEFSARHASNIRKSLLQARELVRVLQGLDCAGIEAIPYKGLVLAETLYGDIAMRQSGDLDILIRARDVARARAEVAKLGYAVHSPLSDKEMERYFNVGYELVFDLGIQRNLLELKWAILPRFYAVDFDMDAMFARQSPGSFAGTRIRQLAPEDLFLVLCAHAAKHCWMHLIWLCDISRLAQQSLDWQMIVAKSRDLGMVRIVAVTVHLLKTLLSDETWIPPAFEAASDSAALEISHEITAEILRGRSPDPESPAYFHRMMRLRERKVDRARFALRLALTPGPSEWHSIKLAEPLAPLYRVVRLARLGSRLVRGAQH